LNFILEFAKIFKIFIILGECWCANQQLIAGNVAYPVKSFIAMQNSTYVDQVNTE
jgi:hypothetical protein